MQSAFFPARQQGQHQQQDVSAVSIRSKHAAATHTSSPKQATPGNLNQSSADGLSSHRVLRFPSSRRYLWDRTAAGPQVLLDVLDYLPHVQVAASTFGAITRTASSKATSLTLQLDLSVSPTNQVTALIQEYAPLSAQQCLQLRCALTAPGAAAADASGSLRAALQAHIDQRDIAKVQQLYVLAATAVAAASPADPTSLRLQLLMPRVGLLAQPLYTKRLCHVPLAESLLKPGCMTAGQTGYLSMDQARSLLPLEATDANVYSTPLVGVWVKGPCSVLHPLVVTACLRFAYSSLLLDRAVNPEGEAFLLLLCPEGDPVSKCYEVRMTDSSKLDLCCYRCEAGVRTAAGMSQFPGGLVSATWVPEQRHIQPLLGSLAATAGAVLPAGISAVCQSKSASPAGSAARSTGYAHNRRGVLQPAAAAVDSPVLHRHSHTSRAGELPLARSSAPSASFSYPAAGDVQHGAAAAAARRSLPLPYAAHTARGGSSSICVQQPYDSHAAGGLSALYPDEPQPRTAVPAVPYVPSTYAPAHTTPWKQRQQAQAQEQLQQEPNWGAAQRQQPYPAFGLEVAAGAAPPGSLPWPSASSPMRSGARAAADGLSSTCSSPSKAGRQQQLNWSDRQDQVLRSSLEGAAEALRASQASLAAARDAAGGAGSRLSSPTKARSTLGDVRPASAPAAPHDLVTAGSGEAAAPPPGHSPKAAGGVLESPQPALPRLGNQHQQQQQLAADVDAELDCGLRMGSPVRASLQKKGSMLAAAAAHAAGMSPAATIAAEGVAHGERPVSPAVQAGVALSNLSLLQHLSSGQLQQALDHSPSARSQRHQEQQQQLLLQEGHILDAVGHAAVAAAGAWHGTSSIQQAAGGWEGQQHFSQDQPPFSQPLLPAAAGYNSALPAYSAAAQSPPPCGSSISTAVRDSFNASHAAAAALHAASASMQRVPVHPYSHSLGVQRYAADVAVMQASSQGSPGGYGLLSPGSSPGLLYQGGGGGWQPLQPQHQHGGQGQLPLAWSPVPPAAAETLRSSMRSSPHWQQQQQQVSPMSAGASPGWVPDLVAQALQGEVDRLRQQLQQLQHQLRLAGMSLRGPDLDAVGVAASPPVAVLAQPVLSMHLAPQAPEAAAGCPTPVVEGCVAGQLSQQLQGTHSPPAAEAAVVGQSQQQPGSGSQQQQYPAVSYARQAHSPAAAAAAPAAASAGRAASTGTAAVAAPADALQQGQAAHTDCVDSHSAETDHAGHAAGSTVHQRGSRAAGAAAPGQPSPSSDQHALVAAAVGAAVQHAAAVAPAARHEATVETCGGAAQAAAATAVPVGNTAAAEPPDGAGAAAEQQTSEASATARQRRRKLDFNAATADQSDSDSPSSSGPGDAQAASAQSSRRESWDCAGSKEASAPKPPLDAPVIATATAAVVPGKVQEPAAPGVADPVACSSPAVNNAPRKASATIVADAAAVRPAAAISCSSAGVRLSMRSSGGGGPWGGQRASLDAPPLVEVVRARVVDLSDDSDEDDWEERLLVKYGLK